MRIFPFGVSRNRLEQRFPALIAATIVRDAHEADMVVTPRTTTGSSRNRCAMPKRAACPSTGCARTPSCRWRTCSDLWCRSRPDRRPTFRRSDLRARRAPRCSRAFEEAEEAIGGHGRRTARRLTPQAQYIRRLQHQLADRYNLGSAKPGSRATPARRDLRTGEWRNVRRLHRLRGNRRLGQVEPPPEPSPIAWCPGTRCHAHARAGWN